MLASLPVEPYLSCVAAAHHAALLQSHLPCIAPRLQAFLIEHDKDTIEFVGNRTECALLMMLRKWNKSYKDVRSANEERVAQVRTHSASHLVAPVSSLPACPAGRTGLDGSEALMDGHRHSWMATGTTGVWLLFCKEDGISARAHRKRLPLVQQGEHSAAECTHVT